MFKKRKLSKFKSKRLFRKGTRMHRKNNVFNGIASTGMRGGVRF